MPVRMKTRLLWMSPPKIRVWFFSGTTEVSASRFLMRGELIGDLVLGAERVERGDELVGREGEHVDAGGDKRAAEAAPAGNQSRGRQRRPGTRLGVRSSFVIVSLMFLHRRE